MRSSLNLRCVTAPTTVTPSLAVGSTFRSYGTVATANKFLNLGSKGNTTSSGGPGNNSSTCIHGCCKSLACKPNCRRCSTNSVTSTSSTRSFSSSSFPHSVSSAVNSNRCPLHPLSPNCSCTQAFAQTQSRGVHTNKTVAAANSNTTISNSSYNNSKSSSLTSCSSSLCPCKLNSSTRSFHTSTADPNAPTVHLSFKQADGSIHKVSAKVGQSLLEVAHDNEIPVEGACEGSLACSTCHVIISEKLFARLQEPCEDEEDMLDLAPDLVDTSRLGCQIIVDKEMEGEEVMLPAHTLNFYVDGKTPTGGH